MEDFKVDIRYNNLDCGLMTINLTNGFIMLTNIHKITVDPSVCNGKPVIRGKRITVQTILEFLAAGDSEEEILKQYPSLEPEDIKAALEYAVQFMGNSFSYKNVV